jgi:hypothetical protein
MKRFDREDYRVMPLAALGLAIGVARVIVYPFMQEQATKAQHVSAAAIQYWSSHREV